MDALTITVHGTAGHALILAFIALCVAVPIVAYRLGCETRPQQRRHYHMDGRGRVTSDERWQS